MWNKAKWLKVPAEEIAQKGVYAYDMTGRFAYFRCEAEAPAGADLTIDISANARYRLWVNAVPVLSGPCKGDTHRQYYETVCLTEYLKPGRNVFCVQVLDCDPQTAEVQTDERASIYGVISHSCGHRLAIEGDAKDARGNTVLSVTTGTADWRVWLDGSYYLKSTAVTEFLGAVVEEFDMAKTPWQWKQPEYDVSAWKPAQAAQPVVSDSPLAIAGVMSRFQMREREIPNAYEIEGSFTRAFKVPSGEEVSFDNGRLQIPSDSETEFVLDAGFIQNTYPAFSMSGGKDAVLSITYFEKFGGAGSDLKRTDYVHGEVSGLTDKVVLPGGEAVFEPFWVRCFRFVRIHVKTNAEPLVLLRPAFKKTGYPLSVSSSVSSSEPWVGRLWEISVRTLENCMLETYMDCPYYEQLQFAMDARLEALYTYAAAADPKMARKCLLDFHYGMLPQGLTPGKYPSVYLQILSTFSLHYIMMAWEYYQETKDAELARICLGDADRILEYCDQHLREDGLLGKLDYWDFVDWREQWNETAGMPEALRYGSSTIISLMYAYALECAQKLASALGREGLAGEYETRQQAILKNVDTYCWDEENGMYREGPSFSGFSCHAQAWAVLCGLKKGEEAARILRNAIGDKDCIRCTFSTSYEWFRALETAGMYEEIRHALDEWIELLALDCTTCPETPTGARSDCHAWSALPIYAMIRIMAGIRRDDSAEDPQYLISPHLMDLKDLRGAAATPEGSIQFDYSGTSCMVTIPEGMKARFLYPDGREVALKEGENVIII